MLARAFGESVREGGALCAGAGVDAGAGVGAGAVGVWAGVVAAGGADAAAGVVAGSAGAAGGTLGVAAGADCATCVAAGADDGLSPERIIMMPTTATSAIAPSPAQTGTGIERDGKAAVSAASLFDMKLPARVSSAGALGADGVATDAATGRIGAGAAGAAAAGDAPFFLRDPSACPFDFCFGASALVVSREGNGSTFAVEGAGGGAAAGGCATMGAGGGGGADASATGAGPGVLEDASAVALSPPRMALKRSSRLVESESDVPGCSDPPVFCEARSSSGMRRLFGLDTVVLP